MRPLVFALFAFVASGVVAQESRVVAAEGKLNREQITFYLSRAELAEIAPWRIEARNASASPKDAMAIARRQLPRLFSPRIRWWLHDVRMREVAPDRWIYVVWCTREYPPTTAVTGGDYVEIPVSMRGATFKPRLKSF